MEPLKFEESIKEKLGQRSIEPSDEGWNKLAGKLEEQENRKKDKKEAWKYRMVAGVALMIGIASFYFGTNTGIESKTTDTVYKDSEQEASNKDKSIRIVQVGRIEKVLNSTKQEEISLVTEVNSQESKTNKAILRNKKNNVLVRKSNKEKLSRVSVTMKKNEVADPIVDPVIKGEKNKLVIMPDVIESKIVGIVEQVEMLKNNDVVVTDEEIDQLLRNAQREIMTQQIIRANSVNASALLQDVESELDLLFKDRVFEALKKGYRKIRTAVVEGVNN